MRSFCATKTWRKNSEIARLRRKDFAKNLARFPIRVDRNSDHKNSKCGKENEQKVVDWRLPTTEGNWFSYY